VLSVKDTDNGLSRFFFSRESRYFSKIGITMEPLTYVPLAKMLYNTPRYALDRFSYAYDDAGLTFIVPKSSDITLPCFAASGEGDVLSTETASVKIPYYASNLFLDSGYSRLNLKIEISKDYPDVTSTAIVEDIELNIKYF